MKGDRLLFGMIATMSELRNVLERSVSSGPRRRLFRKEITTTVRLVWVPSSSFLFFCGLRAAAAAYTKSVRSRVTQKLTPSIRSWFALCPHPIERRLWYMRCT